MKKLILFLLLISPLAGLLSKAQNPNYGDRPVMIGFTYNMGLTSGDTKDFIKQYSFRGMGFEYRYHFDETVGLGLNISWNVFNDKEYGTFTQGTRSATGTQFRYLNIVPIMVSGYYYPTVESEFAPYLAFGVGTVFVNKETDMGVWAVKDDTWHLGITPEAGILFPVSLDVNLLLSVRYNYAFKNSDTINYSYWGFNVGFTF